MKNKQTKKRRDLKKDIQEQKREYDTRMSSTFFTRKHIERKDAVSFAKRYSNARRSRVTLRDFMPD